MEFSILIEAGLLALALSLDALVAGFAYGADGIKIPFRAALVLSGLCSSVLGLSACLGGLLRPLVPMGFARLAGFFILFLLAIFKLFDSSIKTLIRKKKALSHEIAFRACGLHLILKIYADPQEADRDRSYTLSVREAAPLALALSLDGLGVGFGAAMAGVRLLPVFTLSLAAGLAAITLGAAAGRRLFGRLPCDLSWLSGLLLLLLALARL